MNDVEQSGKTIYQASQTGRNDSRDSEETYRSLIEGTARILAAAIQKEGLPKAGSLGGLDGLEVSARKVFRALQKAHEQQ